MFIYHFFTTKLHATVIANNEDEALTLLKEAGVKVVGYTRGKHRLTPQIVSVNYFEDVNQTTSSSD